ncbi:cation:proton antiporter [Streptomyces venezuelae]|uniref:cation:proton antiporter n=1 Tax=Streptomyces venezuelae TaxID=54571 RepID=UPI00278BBB75|nr:cation:proton antiporter [Streptomyces venezuelae]
MDVLNSWPRIPHAVAVLCVVAVIAFAGRWAARLARQPVVVGEVTLGLLAGPAALALMGRPAFESVLPDQVLHLVAFVAEAGLVFYLVGLAHELRAGPSGATGADRRGATALTVGALVAPLFTGLLLVGWVQLTDDAAARGTAPLPAFALMVSVAMSVTAVPVLARILTERGMSRTTAGRLAMTSALVIDAVAWLLFTASVALASGEAGGLVRSLAAVALGIGCATALGLALRTGTARRAAKRFPALAALLLGAAALAVALTMKDLGMTAILGAAMVGFAVPGGASEPWTRTVSTVSRTGRALVPTFFVVSGIALLDDVSPAASWTLIAWTVVLGCLGKGLGSYAGARLDGRPPRLSVRIAVLMNTRGLTELVVVQAGYAAGILSAAMMLALTVMALVTTAMTGPLLDLLDRGGDAPRVEPVPLTTTESGRR